MGQRLVIHVVDDNGAELANAYYHWSAYFRESWHITFDIIDNYNMTVSLFGKKVFDDLSKKEKAIYLLLGSGAGIYDEIFKEKESTEEELNEKYKKDYPDSKLKFIQITEGRNYGLLSITKEGIDNINDYSEGDVYINIDTGKIENCLFFELSDDDNEDDDYDKRLSTKISNISDVSTINLYNSSYEEVENLKNVINNIDDTLYIECSDGGRQYYEIF